MRFVTSNPYKTAETKEILSRANIHVVELVKKIEELQTTDARKLVHDKLLKAFAIYGRPLFVEHTGLYLTQLGGFPGGLTQIFWDALKAERFAELFGNRATDPSATAVTSIAYCDGKKVHYFDGPITGKIVVAPRGSRAFQWDCVFQPDGHAETFAEMGDKKNDLSMRRIALDQMATYLTKTRPA